MPLEITSVADEYIPFLSSQPPLNLRQDLDNYSKCEDCEHDSACVKHRSESVFDKSSDEEMWEMSKPELTLRRLLKIFELPKTCMNPPFIYMRPAEQ